MKDQPKADMEDANDADPIAHPLKWLWHKWNWHQYQTPPWANQTCLLCGN